MLKLKKCEFENEKWKWKSFLKAPIRMCVTVQTFCLKQRMWVKKKAVVRHIRRRVRVCHRVSLTVTVVSVRVRVRVPPPARACACVSVSQ